jgi:hypothetical protein
VNISNVVIKTEAMSELRRYLKWRILTLAARPRKRGAPVTPKSFRAHVTK